jgi:hypothetical protein
LRLLKVCPVGCLQNEPPDVWQQLQQQLPALREHQECLELEESDWTDSSDCFSSDWS